jgi:hypothetical protein
MILTFIVGTAIALLSQATAASLPPATIETAQWSTYEMTLTATDTYDSYASVDLTGVFNGPDGQAIEIKGFWDGDSTFRIRFTPTAEGLWTFMTVSDDPGLDGHLGSIAVVKAAQGAHGFVRQAADASQRWQYDDHTAAANELTAFPIVDHFDLEGLRALDRRVTEAGVARQLAGIVLFGGSDASPASLTEAEMYQYVQYMTARYGAFPNVVWCLHPPASTAGQEKLWSVAGEMTSVLDPYFGSDANHARVLLDACTPHGSLVRPTVGASATGAHIVLAAQQFPNPVQTNAVEGIVRKSDAAAGTLIVHAADGVDHLVHVTKDTVVHGKVATTDLFDGLEEGRHVIVHYATAGEQKTAVEVDRIGDDGLAMMEARVIHINRAKKELTVKLADGSKQTLRLTDRAASEGEEAAAEASDVAMYYTTEAGERVVHFFKRIR